MTPITHQIIKPQATHIKYIRSRATYNGLLLLLLLLLFWRSIVCLCNLQHELSTYLLCSSAKCTCNLVLFAEKKNTDFFFNRWVTFGTVSQKPKCGFYCCIKAVLTSFKSMLLITIFSQLTIIFCPFSIVKRITYLLELVSPANLKWPESMEGTCSKLAVS